MSTTVDREIPYRLKTLREYRGLSQQKLSNALHSDGVNLSKYAIAQVEQGNRSLKIGEAHAITVVLQCALSDLTSDASHQISAVESITKIEDRLEEVETILDSLSVQVRAIRQANTWNTS